MADWPCTVEAEREDPHDTGDSAIRVFTYKRGSLDPISLVAGFGCNLAGFLVETFDEPPPGGDTAREAAVELAAVFMGFGIFLASSAVKQARYCLSEGELAHALALFCQLRDLPEEEIEMHLNPHVRKHVRLAACELAQHELRFRKLRATLAMTPEAADAKSPSRAR